MYHPRPTLLCLLLLGLLTTAFATACDDDDDFAPASDALELVAEIEGVQITGITVTDEGRVFGTFPRWREGVPYTLAEIVDGQPVPYPSTEMNNWDIGDAPTDKLVNVQSAIAVGDTLYVDDTRNPLMNGLITAPRIHLIDLRTNSLLRTYDLPDGTTYPETYVNDLRVDRTRQLVYFTDSGRGGLMVLDLTTGNSWRVLDGHPSVQAEFDTLVIDGDPFMMETPSDGIALDSTGDRLLYHALSGYTLYSVPLDALADSSATDVGSEVTTVATTPAPDGLWRVPGATLMADLENQSVVRVTDGGNVTTLVEGEGVGWADTFTEYDGYLYFTNSRIPESDSTVAGMLYPIWRLPLR
ncbi:major royal jelly protein [Neolewinella xylanilytica]|uniref:Major royal jelly protein n=1 Tax=Neolewinella xylanilytica TaxID=1514080 RepID=A0A2S6I1C5_9BACT|nr:L-dopachrome tautomerase-related protein [Neolewinella xylanilytica]PPK84778.1 major royal jelly protein [Neolewinella xylanilytica]